MNIKELLTAKYIFFLALLVICIYFISQAKEVALLFFGAYVITCSLNPLVDKLSKKIKRGAAAGTVVLVASLIALLFFVPILVISVKEALLFVDNIPERMDNAKRFLMNTYLSGAPLISYLNLDEITANTTSIAKNVLSSSINFTKSFTEAVAIGLSIIMVVFYLLYDKKIIEAKFLTFFPAKLRHRVKEILTAIENKVGGYVIAQGLSMAVVGIFTAIGLSLFKIKYAIVLGLISGLLDIIPIVGPILSFGLSALVAVQNGWIYLIPVIIINVCAQWISNQIVRPLVFGRFMDMHPLLIIFAFLIAAKFLGVWGVILAPAIASLFTVLIDELYLKTLNEKEDEMYPCIETKNEQ